MAREEIVPARVTGRHQLYLPTEARLQDDPRRELGQDAENRYEQEAAGAKCGNARGEERDDDAIDDMFTIGTAS